MFPSERIFRAWNSRCADKEAFTAKNNGYLGGRIFYKFYKSHRVIWAMSNGEWPKADIDHINGDITDNRLCNLRAVSHMENTQNQKLRRTNTSGVMGVSFHKAYQNWVAKIRCNGKVHFLGCFPSKEGAIAAREAGLVRFGFHPNHGKR